MEKAFEINGLTMKFPDFNLGPIDLNLEQGTVLAYIGPNGSGKTTTMQCMVGLLKHDSGKIKIFGKENNPNKPDWKYNIGYVGDKHIFYEQWSGKKNLGFISQFYPDWDDNFAEDLANRFEIPLQKKAKELSTGNRAKLSLIRALSHKPKLLILDEPTSGLDPVVRDEFLDVLFEAVENHGSAVFYSTHILSDISRIADELAFLNNGKIMLRTAKDDLTEKWRTISFKLNKNGVEFNEAVHTEKDGLNYKIISKNYETTLQQLHQLGAENINDVRMSVDEISVQILRNRKLAGE